MSYTELESGYQGLRQNRPGFYVGHDGDILSYVSSLLNKFYYHQRSFVATYASH